jgi:tryptophanyl-tRNA synthetase
MFSDPNRARRSDPGNPDICNVFSYHKLYSPKDVISNVNIECRKAGIGCYDCKKLMRDYFITFFEPIMENRAKLEITKIQDIIVEGDKKARIFAEKTMAEVNNVIGLL